MSAVTDILLAPDVRPFAIAAAIMVTLGGIELLTTLVGFSLSEIIGKDFAAETDSDSGLGGLFLWINAGRLPLLILIVLALGVFAIAAGPRPRCGTVGPGRDRRDRRRRLQPARNPPHQPRHRPHHPARRNLCGE